MDEAIVREHAQALCDAIAAGDIDRAIQDFSPELRSNLGEVIAQLPLPVREASVESVEHGAKGLIVDLRLLGESEAVRLQTRWKERDGRPTIVEVSHIVEPVASTAPEEPAG